MKFERKLSKAGTPVEDQINWKTVHISFGDTNLDVEVPAHWSNMAAQILATKYLRKAGVPQGDFLKDGVMKVHEENVPDWLRRSVPGPGIELGSETSAKQAFHRLASAWTYHGWKMGLFNNYETTILKPDTERNAQIFYDELYLILAKQLAAPNSPQWFNTGLWWAYGIEGSDSGQWAIDYSRNPSDPDIVFQPGNSYEFPQPHACFIQPVEDDLCNPGGIMNLWEREARLFKHGSGTGSNFSNIRGEGETLFGGGKSSGLMSFLEIGDRAAGAIKSGGTCLAPYQRVYTEHGPVPVEQLAKRNGFIALSYDPPSGRYKAKRARAWMAGTKNLVRITTDKGTFILSDDHPCRLSDGIFVKAGDLKSGMSLFACSVDEQDGRPRVHLKNGRKGKEFWHRMIASDILGWDINAGIVHHVDENVHNNEPSNLELKTQSHHAREHGIALVEKGIHVFQTQRFPRIGGNNGMYKDSVFWSDEEKVNNYRTKQAEILRRRGNAAELQNAAASQKILNTVFKVLNMGGNVSSLESYIRARELFIGKIADKRKVRQSVIERFGSWENLLGEMDRLNHRVTTVETVGPSEVYDVEIECPTLDDKSPSTGHNFVIWPGDSHIGSGIVVANTRRAAKMVIVDADHPDIEKFIWWKAREEQKAAAMWIGSKILTQADTEIDYRDKLIADGLLPQAMSDQMEMGQIEMEEFGINYEGEAIRTVGGQNANNSVRLTYDFMNRVKEGFPNWELTERTTRAVVKRVNPKDLFNQICRAAWASGDPGLQFHDTINLWHTCKVDGEIRASNPCCFVGNTLVDTSEGLITIEELANMDYYEQELPYAFCFDRNSALPALRKIKKAWSSGYARKLVKVRLDTGEEFTCTPEHRWLLRNGEYVAAQNLVKGMSLRKIGRTINDERGSRCSILHRCTDEVSNGTQYQSRWMWEQINGPIGKGFEVHHRDDDPTNDRLSNFELIESVDHRINHMAGSSNPRYKTVDDKALVEIYDAILSMPRKTHKLKSGVTIARWNAYIREHGLSGIIPQAQSPTTGGKIQGMYWHEFVAKMEKIRGEVNARVLEVITVQTDEDVAVFDIEVEGTHNFAIRGNREKNQPSIVVSNSEYMFLDNTACNLASLNLGAFYYPSNLKDRESTFDVELFKHVTRLITCVLDISVSMASFPSKEIAIGSYNYRTLGLGYTNLGGLLMRMGLGYDSNDGRNVAASITALMTGEAYATSARLAEELGTFPRWKINKTSMSKVIHLHRSKLKKSFKETLIWREASRAWDIACGYIEAGFRNAQVTLLAPTGTIGLLMDCDTLGIEPEYSFEKTKNLAGGGQVTLLNNSVEEALVKLEYNGTQRNLIRAHLSKTGSVKGSPDLNPSHLPVFACANDAGGNTLTPTAHIFMMAVVQPFLSGAISKTVNLPNNATVDDFKEVYLEAWKLGLKAVAPYRDGAKLAQPLQSAKPSAKPDLVSDLRNMGISVPEEAREYINEPEFKSYAETFGQGFTRGIREYLPWRRQNAYTQKVKIGDQSVHLTVGCYPDGRPGEIRLELSRVGTSLNAMANMVAMMVSIGLQYGVPVSEFVERLKGRKFEPSGLVEGHENIKIASSVADFIAKELGITFLDRKEMGEVKTAEQVETQASFPIEIKPIRDLCPECHEPCLIRTGTCQTCSNCGYNDGCGG